MDGKVLLVDDDAEALEMYRDTLAPSYVVDTAGGGEAGLESIARSGPYAVIVSDMHMPRMDGIRFLARVREIAPSTVRILMTAHANLDAAIDAVNRGWIFRFLTKPCPPDILVGSLNAGMEQYRLVTGERILLEKTLSGAIHILLDVLGLLSPMAFGRSSRVKRLVGQLAAELGIDAAWQAEVAAMLSQLGCVAIPGPSLERIYAGKRLTAVEQRMFERHPAISHDLVARVPRLEGVASILAYQEQRYDGTGIPPDGVRGAALPLGARLLKVALDFDTLILGGMRAREALIELRARTGWYDPAVIGALGQLLTRPTPGPSVVRGLAAGELQDGMVFAEDARSVTGVVLADKGSEVTWSVRMRLADVAERGDLVQPLQMLVSPGPGA
jgi:response regulator RpfG family c-di-GMP phosphodiesterase